MNYLSFISNANLESAVRALMEKSSAGLKNAKNDPERNVLDPFALFFQMACSQVEFETIMNLERTRQAQKTLTNSIGIFHQTILGNVKDWENFGKGAIVDLCCSKKKIVAEIKNKYNTVKGSDLKNYYEHLEEIVMHKTSKYHGYTAYLVEIIPRRSKPYNEPFTPSDNRNGKVKSENHNIRICDGKTFYHLATGIPNALHQLYGALPDVVQAITKKSAFQSNEDKIKLDQVYHKSFGI